MLYKLFSILLLLSFADGASAQNQQIDLDLIKLTVERWSDAHNTKDKEVFKKLYASTVLFYTKELTQIECIQIKFERLNSGKAFSQKIITDLTNTVYQSGIIKCEFTKEVTSGLKVRQYKSYLLVELKNDTYQIVGEGDLQTDAKLKYTLDLGPKYKVEEIEAVSFAKNDMNESVTSSSNVRRILSVLMWVLIVIAFTFGLYLIYEKFKENKSVKRTNASFNKQNASFDSNASMQERVYSRQRRFVRIASKKNSDKSSGNSSAIDVIKKKGDDFEGYINDQFDPKYFKLLQWNADVYHKGRSPESNKHPDLIYEFNHRDFRKTFAVECKFRSKLLNNRFEIESYKLDNYRNYHHDKKTDVYIALGLYGEASKPEKIYLIPLSAFVDRNFIVSSELNKFRKSSSKFFYERTLDVLK